MGYNPLLSLLTLMLRLPQLWLVGAPSSWLLCLSFFGRILTSGTRRSGSLSQPQPALGHFAKHPCFSLVRGDSGTQIRKLGVLIATEVSLLTSLQWAAWGEQPVHTILTFPCMFVAPCSHLRSLAPNDIHTCTPLPILPYT